MILFFVQLSFLILWGGAALFATERLAIFLIRRNKALMAVKAVCAAFLWFMVMAGMLFYFFFFLVLVC